MRFSKNDSSEDRSDDAADSKALRLTWQCLLLTFPSSLHLPLYIFASIISSFELYMSDSVPPHSPIGSHNAQDDLQDLQPPAHIPHTHVNAAVTNSF